MVEAATLVIGPKWIGDMIMAQCLLKALKLAWPEREIDVMAPKGVADVVRRMPEVRSWLDSPFEAGRLQLKARADLGRTLKGRYGQAFVLTGTWKSALVPFFARIERRTGFRREWRVGLLNDIRPLPGELKRRTAAAFQLLAGPGDLLHPALSIDRAEQRRLLGHYGLAPQGFISLFPGAEFGPAKRWPSRHYADVARRIEADHGLRSVIFGSIREKEIGEEIAALVPSALNLAGKTRLGEAVDLISAARFAITNDTGLMHVAAAVGIPVVAVYGSTSPKNTPALTDRASLLSVGLPCSPCHRRVCPFGHLKCLNGLKTETVLGALNGLQVV
jgi:heptosyltransferase II